MTLFFWYFPILQQITVGRKVVCEKLFWIVLLIGHNTWFYIIKTMYHCQKLSLIGSLKTSRCWDQCRDIYILLLLIQMFRVLFPIREVFLDPVSDCFFFLTIIYCFLNHILWPIHSAIQKRPLYLSIKDTLGYISCKIYFHNYEWPRACQRKHEIVHALCSICSTLMINISIN